MSETTESWKLNGAETCGDPEQDAARRRVAEKEYTKGFIAIGREPTANAYSGIIEHSFSMDTSPERVRLFRIRADGFEGRASAEHNAKKFGSHYEVYDIDDPACPVILDWVDYEKIVARKTDKLWFKFETRNLKFRHKE